MTLLPAFLQAAFEEAVGSKVEQVRLLSGGSINQTARVTTRDEDFFIKWNDKDAYPGMLRAEERGLALLARANAIRIPQVIACGEGEEFQYLILQFIKEASRTKNYWIVFGEKLAILHGHAAGSFGLEHDNYMGSLPQRNTLNESWPEFFAASRLRPQLDLARASNLLTLDMLHRFDRLMLRLPELLPQRKPALVHGDLWSGNLITDSEGLPCLIDPAVYYGDGEVDLAMTGLFGGIDPVFLESYFSFNKPEPGWRERFDLYNLYPLLVHVNLFGKSYLSQVVSILNKLV